MIITRTCDVCGYANDNNNGPCHNCGGQTEQRLIRGRWQTVLITEPTRPQTGFYNSKVRRLNGEKP